MNATIYLCASHGFVPSKLGDEPVAEFELTFIGKIQNPRFANYFIFLVLQVFHCAGSDSYRAQKCLAANLTPIFNATRSLKFNSHIQFYFIVSHNVLGIQDKSLIFAEERVQNWVQAISGPSKSRIPEWCMNGNYKIRLNSIDMT